MITLHVPPLPRLPFGPRRNEVRYPAAFRVILRSARTKDRLTTWDVSYRGLYLASTRLLPAFQLVQLAISLPTSPDELTVHGMVVSSVEAAAGGDGRPRGMGIELYALARDTRATWWEAVRFARDHAREADLAGAPASR